MTNPLPIATRTSPLATTQTKDVQARLAAATGRTAEIDFPILGLQTTGDRITDRALLAAGGKGLFTKELDAALLSGQARFAVHSMKDVPTRLPEGLEIAAILEREDPRDVLITNSDIARVDDLPEGAVLGTASIRRQAQALRRRPDLKIVLLRGNVDTRLEKIRSGEIDATFLARAGLRRLGRAEAGRDPVCDSEMIPAPAQGCVGVAIRSDDDEAREIVRLIDHAESHVRARAERGFLSALDGSCRTPIAAHAAFGADGKLHLRGEALATDGAACWSDSVTAVIGLDAEAAEALGRKLGAAVKAAGGAELAAIVEQTG